MSTADADGYGTASALLAAERGLDLSLHCWHRPDSPGRAPDRFAVRGSVNTASVELDPARECLNWCAPVAAHWGAPVVKHGCAPVGWGSVAVLI